MTLFEENLRVLARTRPRLAARVAATEPLPPAQRIPTKSGGWTAQVEPREGGRILLASKYGPEEEAKRLIDSFEDEIGPTTSFLVLGMGMGYHVLELHRRKMPEGRVIVVEADLRVFRTALESADYTAFLADDKVHLHAGDQLQELFLELRGYIFEFLAEETRAVKPEGPRPRTFKLVRHSPSIKAAPDYYRDFTAQWDEFLRASKMSIESAMVLARQSFENRFANLAHYLPSPGTRILRGRWTGIPGVIVSAGPSLYHNIDRLRELEGRSVIIAVSTSLKPLLARGIRPTLSVLLDYHEVSRRYFDRIDPEVAARIPLVVDPKASPAAVAAYSGPLLFGADQFLDQLLPGLAPHRGDLAPGSTVAHTAFHVAHYCGCDPIVFVGQDLAYSYHVTHVPGTSIYGQWLPELNRFQTLETKEWESILRLRGVLTKVKAKDGSEIYTDGQMLAYRKDFEALISLGGRTYVDATEGGALIEGTRVMPLAEVIETWVARVPPGRVEVPVAPTPPGERRRLLEGGLEAIGERMKDTRRMNDLYRRALRTLERIRKRIDREAPVDKLINEVHRVRTRTREFEHIFQAISNIAFSDSFKRQAADRRIRSENLPGREKQKEQAQRDLEFIDSLVRSLDYFRNVLVRARAALEKELESP